MGKQGKKNKGTGSAVSGRSNAGSIAFFGVVGIICAAILGGALWSANRVDAVNVPKGALADGGGFVVGDGPVRVDMWEDFQCPGCGVFENQYASLIDEYVADGKIEVVYHMLTFLDRVGPSRSSTRAANAAACAADQDRFAPFHAEVYRNQPAVEGTGWTDQELLGFAETAGVADIDAFESCMTDERYRGYLQATMADMEAQGVTSTPTVFIDGVAVEDNAKFRELLDAAVTNG